MELEICAGIRHVPGGYIVNIRWPYGPRVVGCGEVICKSLDEVFRLIKKADIDTIWETPMETK